jgi:hypothetical protein
MDPVVFIFPGLSSPAAEYYRDGYQAVTDEARRRGFEPELIHYPGQQKPDGRLDGVLSLRASVADGCARIEAALASGAKTYRLIGFSFGCFVALRIAQQLQDRPPQLVTLWGPLPFWKCWDNYCGDRTDRHTGSGTRILMPLEAFFGELVPIEHLIGTMGAPLHVCLGEKDEYAPPAFLEYLKHGCGIGAKRERHFTLGEGCTHTMMPSNEGWSKYAEALFWCA